MYSGYELRSLLLRVPAYRVVLCCGLQVPSYAIYHGIHCTAAHVVVY
jgi:hypothetical protein